MASRHVRFSPVTEYQTQHVTATGTNVPIGTSVGTTAPTTIVAGSQVVTPASMSNIQIGQYLNFAGGTGAAEDALVRGVFLGPIIIGNPGTSMVLSLFNGHPNASPAGTTVAVITVPASATSYPFAASFDQGAYYTLAGTPGDITLQYLSHSS